MIIHASPLLKGSEFAAEKSNIRTSKKGGSPADVLLVDNQEGLSITASFPPCEHAATDKTSMVSRRVP